jgi:hypothetical protein
MEIQRHELCHFYSSPRCSDTAILLLPEPGLSDATDCPLL